MRSLMIITAAALTAGLAGCTSIPGDMSVGDYCANPSNTQENVCRLKVEIDGNSTALSETNLSLNNARSLADNAISAAAEAQATADAAMTAAQRAQATADRALLEGEDLACTTRTINNSNIGTCEAGYELVSCTQTRYTTRAGGLSFLRELNSEQCRFNSRVLEMDVRCCTTDSLKMSTASAIN
ncbi:MAG: hypothetical protein Hens3KO_28190 [Henriciella sp.]